MFRRRFKKSKRFSSKPKLSFASKKVDRKQNQAIIKLSKKVKRIDRSIELKQLQNYQSSYSGSSITTTVQDTSPQMFLLNGSIQGTSTVTRIGDKINMTSMHLTGQVYVTSGGSSLGINAPVRIMVFLFKKPRGELPLLTSGGVASGNSAIFYNNGASPYPTTYQQYDTGVNQAMYQNYKILYDRVFTLKTLVGGYVPSTDATNSVNPFFNFNIRKKLGYVADYSRGTAGNYLDFEANALYIAFITDTNATLTVDMDSRIYFKDA